MQIYIDGTPLFRKPDGVGRYSSSIVSELIKIDSSNTYRALGFVDDLTKPHAVPKSALKYDYLPFPRPLYSQVFKRLKPLSVNRWLKKQPDVVIYPNFVAYPKIKGAKKILVIHDLAFISTAHTLAKRNLNYLERFVPRSIKTADALVAVSEETRDAIAQNYGVNASDITVVPNAVDNRFFTRHTQAELDEVRQRYGLPDKFILHIGTIEPRKNIARLVEAYAALPAKLREEYPLVLGGKAGWNSDDVFKRIHELMEQGHSILTIGYVEDDDLPLLYRAADVFVFPSLHEGFGLPILEAFAARTPVVTSNIAPMNRIAEDAAVFIDPEDENNLRQGLERVLKSKTLRDDLIRKGDRVAKKHSWHASAEILKELINSLA